MSVKRTDQKSKFFIDGRRNGEWLSNGSRKGIDADDICPQLVDAVSRDADFCFGCDEVLFNGTLSIKDSWGICVETNDTDCKWGYDGDDLFIDELETYFVIIDGGWMMSNSDVLFIPGLKVEPLDKMFGFYCWWFWMSFHEIVHWKTISLFIIWFSNFHNS